MSSHINAEIKKAIDALQVQGSKDCTECRKCMYGQNEGGWWRETMQECTWSHCPLYEESNSRIEYVVLTSSIFKEGD